MTKRAKHKPPSNGLTDDESEKQWADFRLKHAHLYSKRYRESEWWPFTPPIEFDEQCKKEEKE